MASNYDYSYEWDKKYCYSNSNVLKNKFNIINNNELEIVEREFISLRMAEATKNLVKGNFDLKHLQDIHKHIFKDIYDWAGELRTVNISKGNPFYNYMYILDGAEGIFSKLKREDYPIGISKENIYDRLAYYLGEINVLHPFREGNGRAQRVMIEYLAQVAGYDIDFFKVSDIEMIEASVDAFNCDYTKMIALFKKITNSITKEEQSDFIKKLSPGNSPVMKVYRNITDMDI